MASQLEVPSRLVLALKRRKVKIPKHRKPGNRRSVLRKMEESMEESMKESIKESSRRKLAPIRKTMTTMTTTRKMMTTSRVLSSQTKREMTRTMTKRMAAVLQDERSC